MLSHLLAGVVALSAADAPPLPPLPAAAADARSAMTVRQAVGQHMVFAYDGLTPPPQLRTRIARGEAAGVILFTRNVRSAGQVRAAIDGLQAIRRPPGLRAPLIVMTDQEGGVVRRIPGAPARGAGDVTTPAEARADGRAAARTLRGAGVNVDLAPVADVARAGAALEREGRTYGRSAADVTAEASAFAGGLRAGGVRPVAKHFPGFGAAQVNTDDAPARIETPLAQLRAVDQPPFVALIAGGTDAVMMSTAVYPALDMRPAAFSSRWIKGELRTRLGFGGVVVTDDLGTPAVSSFGSNGRRAMLAVKAGVDLPLFVSGYRAGAQAAEGLVAAAGRGELSAAELQAGAQRVLAMRAKLARRR